MCVCVCVCLYTSFSLDSDVEGFEFFHLALFTRHCPSAHNQTSKDKDLRLWFELFPACQDTRQHHQGGRGRDHTGERERFMEWMDGHVCLCVRLGGWY